jgi:AcrR family transcriptional regulator
MSTAKARTGARRTQLPKRKSSAKPAVLTKGDRSRQILEDCAKKVIRRMGFLNTRVSDITREAGMSVGSFYSYYEDKEALLAAMAENVIHQVETYQLALGPTGVDQIEPALKAYWELYAANLDAIVSVYQTSLIDARYLKIWRRIQSLGIQAHISRIKVAQAAGYCPGLDPELAGASFQAMVEKMFYYKHFVEVSMEGKKPSDSVNVIDTLHKIIYHGIMWK